MNERLDVFLFEQGYFESREKAKTNIMAGNVTINGVRRDKPGEKIKEINKVEIKEKDINYVSRGGLKLEKALEVFDFQIEDMVAMDIGASTGGFTDCMLQKGAKKVYAIDVGYGQLDYGLRKDSRVISMERKNFRYMSFEEIGECVDRATMDVSFISITKLLDNLKVFLKEKGEGIILIKPQFEAGREYVGKNGIIRDKAVHKKVIIDTIDSIQEKGFIVLGLDYSPVKGTKGNIEYICHIRKESQSDLDKEKLTKMIEDVVYDSHNEL
ncbi:TlyA family rRNA (cytidine-2'-O)-methyltransferase [Alkalibaculum sp. M08DMB]|uniref:TlyA family rRNA (Cytidine-2'-O)-methyltransferase n=1 Tax=Alkalibaculum sporogenes TaxID=2655001 RepID=A0A6A7K6X4_9FIRM|nr:TlyA family RNA methyltransferase [Alkalibaculum sporogenes]MPW25164.1 TlyA family rRNA (cytidine-2'-O)-methyltransferase [Alkalibaculum sporogenes]